MSYARSPLARTKPLTRSEPLKRTAGLKRGTGLSRKSAAKRFPCSPATAEQKAKVRDRACVAMGDSPCGGPVDPAHLIDRSIASAAGDDPRAVIPLCRRHHDLYDGHELDLSPYLEPHWRAEVAWAVEAVGLFRALRRITGKDWGALEATV